MGRNMEKAHDSTEKPAAMPACTVKKKRGRRAFGPCECTCLGIECISSVYEHLSQISLKETSCQTCSETTAATIIALGS